MELKKIFPKWWHPAIIAAIIVLLGTPSEGPINIVDYIMFMALMYVVLYIGFIFCRTGYLVIKDIFKTIAG